MGTKTASDPLDYPLMAWNRRDVLTRRDLLRSISVKGITGSGKSSGSLATLLNAIVADALSTCLIIAQKPEDKDYFLDLYRRHGKLDRLLVMEPGGRYKCNFLECEMRAGADRREIVEFIINQGEALDSGQSGGGEDMFWKQSKRRHISNLVGAVMMGSSKLSATSLRDFNATAAHGSAELADERWQKGHHAKVLLAARDAKKSPIDEHDFRGISTYWLDEFPNMDNKPRSSIEADVLNVLHAFSEGLVQEICSTEMTVSPRAFDRGYSILVNFPCSQYNATGKFISGGMRYLTGKHILRRHWEPGQFYNVEVCDEFQESVTGFDARYIAQCRSHGGCLLTATQSVASEHSAIGGGHAGHHKVEALTSNYGHHIFHTVDPQTAEVASKMLGQRRESFVSVSAGEQQSLWDELTGKAKYNSTLSEQYCPIVQTRDFQAGMRCGGPPDYTVDGYVIRMGLPFSTGENYLRVAFPQS